MISSLGTLGYVMSEVEKGKPFSEVVNGAKTLGYTEPGNTLLFSVHCLIQLNYAQELFQKR